MLLGGKGEDLLNGGRDNDVLTAAKAPTACSVATAMTCWSGTTLTSGPEAIPTPAKRSSTCASVGATMTATATK